MYTWEAIQEALDRVEQELPRGIKTEWLAEQVSLSPFYFQKLFKRLVHKSVQEYIKLRRLSRVIEELNQEDRTITEIAYDYHFSSPANFTRVFKETYGITPEEDRKKRPRLNTMIKPDIALIYKDLDENIPILIDDLLLEIRRETLETEETYLGFSTLVDTAKQIPMGESTGIDIPGQCWTRFHQEKSKLKTVINPDFEMGMSYSADPIKGTFHYFTGALYPMPQEISEPYVIQSLPPGNYIVCRIEAENFETLVCEGLDKAVSYLLNTWLPSRSLEIELFSAEKYNLAETEDISMELWVKLKEPTMN